MASAFTLYFDLVNLAEERSGCGHCASGSAKCSRPRCPNRFAEAVGQIKASGVTAEEMAALMARLQVELVLTAHPTEAKRRTILSKVQRISRALKLLEESDLLPREREEALRQVLAEITSVLLSNRARTAKPAVTDEVRTGLYFVDAIFWDALPRIYADLEVALAEHYPGLPSPPRWLTLASWIGGDRDGNPNVTAAVTAETLRLHRGLAVERHRARLQELPAG